MFNDELTSMHVKSSIVPSRTNRLVCFTPMFINNIWAISALATEKLQIRCVMETHIVTIKPPLQIVDVGNGCKAYSASIYIPVKSELTTMIQSITRSQLFLDYNFNYTNVSKFLIWHKTNFATLTPDEIKSLKAKNVKNYQHIPMEIFKESPWEH